MIIKKLKEMVLLQDKMNSIVNPDWRNAGNNWLRATWIEAAEMMDFLNYKWWKKQTFNKVQAQLELVDAFHFLLSECIERDISVIEIAPCFNKKRKEAVKENSSIKDTRGWVEEFVKSILNRENYSEYLTIFAILCDELDLSFDKLHNLYISKNVLNIFRQDHGYKEGSYIKKWKSDLEPNGLIEDNVYLEIFVKESLTDKPKDTFTYLYDKLEEEYKNNLIKK